MGQRRRPSRRRPVDPPARDGRRRPNWCCTSSNGCRPSLPCSHCPSPRPSSPADRRDQYPWSWSICPWLAGVATSSVPPTDPHDGRAHARRIRRRACIDPRRPTHRRTHFVASTSSSVPMPCVNASLPWPTARPPNWSLAVWDDLRSTRPWSGPALWLHGDLHPSNMLTNEGRLAAIIDFGDITSGDPATDLAVAWMMFAAAERAVFREVACDRRRHLAASRGLGGQPVARLPHR